MDETASTRRAWPIVEVADGRDRDREGSVAYVGSAGVGKSTAAAKHVARWSAQGRPVVSATATATSASIPLGVFASFVPVDAADDRGASAIHLRRTMDAVAPLGGIRPIVLVDDAHHLDAVSAVLIDSLVRSGRADIALTLRVGVPVADAIFKLFADGIVDRVELGPLDRACFDRLLAFSLPGGVDGLTSEHLWRVTLGNPLYLRELVRHGRKAGTLNQRSATWHWEGDLDRTFGLAEAIERRLAALTPHDRAGLEALAVAAPVRLAAAELLVGRRTLEQLDRYGFVRFDTTSLGIDVHVEHPMLAEVVRTCSSPVALRRARTRVASLYAGAAGSPVDMLRAAIALEEAGDRTRPDILVAGARRARSLLAVTLVERLAIAALDAGAGPDTAETETMLAEALEHQGRHGEALDVLRSFAESPSADQIRSRAVVAATNLYWGHARPIDAEAALTESPEIDDDELVATRAWIQFFDNRLDEAVRASSSVLARSTTSRRAFGWAATVCGAAAAVMGDGEHGRIVTTAGIAAAADIAAENPFGPHQVGWAHGFVLTLNGNLEEAEGMLADGFERTRRTSGEMAGAWAGFLSFAARLSGKMITAGRALDEALALLGPADPYRFRHILTAELGAIRAWCGDLEAADRCLAAVAAAPTDVNQFFGPWVKNSCAWVDRAHGRHRAARAGFQAAVDGATSSGQTVMAALFAYDSIRAGEAVGNAVAVLGRSAHRADSRLVRALLHAGSAVLDGNGTDAVEAADSLAAVGATLHAAELYRLAAVRLRRTLQPIRAAQVAERAAIVLIDAEPGSAGLSQSLLADDGLAALSPRQREVAALAARGSSSAAIAAQLAISVRTVDNHLGHVFTALGVTDRRALGLLLQPQR